jgi:hypothetical protein
MNKSKCDCIPGEFLCREAVELWADYGRAYNARNWEEMNKKYEQYQKHISRAETIKAIRDGKIAFQDFVGQ